MSILSGFGYVLAILVLLLCLASYLCSKRALSAGSSSVTGDETTNSTDQQIAGGAGLDEATITSYPKLSYSKVKLQYGNSTSCCCSICLADYKESDTLLVLPDCGHLFHVKCVHPWLRLNATCPICRNSPSPPFVCIPCAQLTSLQQ